MPKIKPFENHLELYEEWFENNKIVFESEVKTIRKLLPVKGKGIELGVGTGQFSSRLGIETGLDPSKQMRKVAQNRGITTIDGVAEALPFKKSEFDFVLFVICYNTLLLR